MWVIILLHLVYNLYSAPFPTASQDPKDEEKTGLQVFGCIVACGGKSQYMQLFIQYTFQRKTQDD